MEKTREILHFIILHFSRYEQVAVFKTTEYKNGQNF